MSHVVFVEFASYTSDFRFFLTMGNFLSGNCCDSSSDVALPRWVFFICASSRALRLKDRSHISHANPFSPVWLNMWARSCVACMKLLGHIVQACGRTPVCIFIWRFSVSLAENDFLHCEWSVIYYWMPLFRIVLPSYILKYHVINARPLISKNLWLVLGWKGDCKNLSSVEVETVGGQSLALIVPHNGPYSGFLPVCKNMASRRYAFDGVSVELRLMEMTCRIDRTEMVSRRYEF